MTYTTRAALRQRLRENNSRKAMQHRTILVERLGQSCGGGPRYNAILPASCDCVDKEDELASQNIAVGMPALGTYPSVFVLSVINPKEQAPFLLVLGFGLRLPPCSRAPHEERRSADRKH